MNKSLRMKLMLPILLLIVAIITASMFYMTMKYEDMAVQYLSKDINNRSKTLAYTVAMGLNDANFDLVNYSFKSVQEDKNFTMIAIVDENKELLIEHNPKKLKLDIAKEVSFKKVRHIDNELAVATPVVYNDKPLGFILLRYSLKEMNEQLNSNIIQGVMIFSLFLFISIVVVIFVMKPIIKNINKLKDFALAIKAGNLKSELQLDAQDELGELAKTFNTMKTTIQSIIAEINKLTDEIKNGNLDARGEDERFEGAYKNIITGINTMFDNVLAPLQEISVNVDLIAKGVLPAKITNEDYLKLSSVHSVNSLIDSIKLLIEESRNSANAAIAGRLNYRADSSRLDGEFKSIINGMNKAIDRLVGLIDNMPMPVQIVDKELKIIYNNKLANSINKN